MAVVVTKDELIAASLEALDQAHHLERNAKFSNKDGGMERLLHQAAMFRLASRALASRAHGRPI